MKDTKYKDLNIPDMETLEKITDECTHMFTEILAKYIPGFSGVDITAALTFFTTKMVNGFKGIEAKSKVLDNIYLTAQYLLDIDERNKTNK